MAVVILSTWSSSHTLRQPDKSALATDDDGAATVICLAIEAAIPVQQVPYMRLRARLLADGQRLVPSVAALTHAR
ncbi:MAG: hypothetical protein WCJ18_10405 [Planctomycetota bacterium]